MGIDTQAKFQNILQGCTHANQRSLFRNSEEVYSRAYKKCSSIVTTSVKAYYVPGAVLGASQAILNSYN